MSKRAIAVLAAVVALLACAAVATGLTSGGGQEQVATQIDPATTDAATREALEQLKPDASGRPSAIPEQTKAVFGVFRRAQSASDRPSGDVPDRVARFGGNAALARLVVAGDSGRADKSSYYAVPSSNGEVCLVDQTASGGCSPIANLKVNGSFGTNECVMQGGTAFITLHGLAPDGVSEVTLTAPNGDEQAIAVNDNGWYAQARQFPAASRPETLSWTDAAGKAHSLPLPVSPDVNNPC